MNITFSKFRVIKDSHFKKLNRKLLFIFYKYNTGVKNHSKKLITLLAYYHTAHVQILPNRKTQTNQFNETLTCSVTPKKTTKNNFGRSPAVKSASKIAPHSEKKP